MDTFIIGGKVWWQEHEAPGYNVFVVRKERDRDAGLSLLSPFYSVWNSYLRNVAAHCSFNHSGKACPTDVPKCVCLLGDTKSNQVDTGY